MTRAYLAGLGTAGSLVCCAALLFVLAGALLTFNGWPRVASASGPSTQRVVVSAPASAPTDAPEATVTISQSNLHAPVAPVGLRPRAVPRGAAHSTAVVDRRGPVNAPAGGSGAQPRPATQTATATATQTQTPRSSSGSNAGTSNNNIASGTLGSVAGTVTGLPSSGSSSSPVDTVTAVAGQTVTAGTAAATGTIAGLTSQRKPAE